VVRSAGELREEVRRYLEDPDHDLSRRRHALQAECFRDDGLATDRVLEAVHQIFNSMTETV
jgi:hypothetical protein